MSGQPSDRQVRVLTAACGYPTTLEPFGITGPGSRGSTVAGLQRTPKMV